MSNDKITSEELGNIIILGIVALLVCGFAFYHIGHNYGELHTQQRAAQNQAGEWRVDNDGNTSFHWLPLGTSLPHYNPDREAVEADK